MKFVRSMIPSVVLGAIIALGCSIADAQQPARQPTRRVQGGPTSETPQLDQRTGQFRIDRRVIRPGLRLLPQRPVPRWRLGIQVDDSPRGLRISEVSRNSPAFRFGLERGDYLLDVMGYPVGFHGSAYFPLADTLNQMVQRDGWVNVLVWNRRTHAEEAIWIQAEPRQAVQPPTRPTRPIPPRRQES
ncbi:MAG TPA: PDZ domain-containing protein [Lacipirellulaceae bacterium]|nr:PDZ domain-containing protein [Lacipirellulaceae bacterium]